MKQPGANLITVTKEKLVLTMLPRTNGKFTKFGLRVNALRYKANGYTEQYLSGGDVTIAYNPEDVSSIYLIEDDYAKFDLIESRYKGKPLAEVEEMQKKQKAIVKSCTYENLQAKVDLARNIEAITSKTTYKDNVNLEAIKKNRQKEKNQRHKDLVQEVTEA
jgi:hypothetical protein